VIEDPRIREIRDELSKHAGNLSNIYDGPGMVADAEAEHQETVRVLRRIRAILDSAPPAPRVWFPGDTVPAGTPLMLEDGSLLEADTGDERWDINDGIAVELLGVPTREEWQAAVDRAKTARGDVEGQHTEGSNP
jgi:hypothetical protein